MNRFTPPLKVEPSLTQAAPRGETELRGAAVERRKACVGEAPERLPPAFAVGLRARDDGEVEGEMGEDVADRAEGVRPAGHGVAPLASGERRHSAEHALGGS